MNNELVTTRMRTVVS